MFIYSVYECQFTLDKLKQSSEMEKSTALGARQVKEEDDTEKEIVDSSADKIIDLAVVKTEDTLSKDCNQNIIITPSIQTNSNKGDSLKKESKRQKAKSMPHGIMRAKHPWFTEEFIALLKQREALNCSLKMNPDNIELRREFSLVRNRASSVRKKLKRQYQVYLEEL